MNKRVLIVFCLLFCLTACNKKVNLNYNYDIKSCDVDMSSYEGITSTNHNFKLVEVSELFNTIDNASSALFYFGRSNCGCCQKVTRYLNEVALDLNVTIYYIDAYNPNENLVDDEEKKDKLYNYMYSILGKNDEGEKTLLTPHLFQVINGKLEANQICFNGITSNNELTDKDIKKLKEVYRKILLPFVS